MKSRNLMSNELLGPVTPKCMDSYKTAVKCIHVFWVMAIVIVLKTKIGKKIFYLFFSHYKFLH